MTAFPAKGPGTPPHTIGSATHSASGPATHQVPAALASSPADRLDLDVGVLVERRDAAVGSHPRRSRHGGDPPRALRRGPEPVDPTGGRGRSPSPCRNRSTTEVRARRPARRSHRNRVENCVAGLSVIVATYRVSHGTAVGRPASARNCRNAANPTSSGTTLRPRYSVHSLPQQNITTSDTDSPLLMKYGGSTDS